MQGRLVDNHTITVFLLQLHTRILPKNFSTYIGPKRRIFTPTPPPFTIIPILPYLQSKNDLDGGPLGSEADPRASDKEGVHN